MTNTKLLPLYAELMDYNSEDDELLNDPEDVARGTIETEEAGRPIEESVPAGEQVDYSVDSISV